MEQRRHAFLGAGLAVPVIVIGAMNAALAAPEPAEPALLVQAESRTDLDGATFTTALGDGVYALSATSPTTPLPGLLTVAEGLATADMDDSWTGFTVLAVCATPSTTLDACPNLVRLPWFAAEGITGGNHTELLEGAPAFPLGTLPTFSTTLDDGTFHAVGEDATGECRAQDVTATVEGGTVALDGLGLCGAQTESVWRLKLQGYEFSVGVFASGEDPSEEPTTDPTAEPTTEDPSDGPTTDPTEEPTTEDPTQGPTTGPTEVPTNEPTAEDPSPEPGVDPGVDPGLDPGADPGFDPGLDPGVDPGAEPGVDPGVDPGLDPGGPAIISGPAEILNVDSNVLLLMDDHEQIELKLGASLDQEVATSVTLRGVPAGMRFTASSMTLAGAPSARGTTRMTAVYAFDSGRVLETDYFVNVTNDTRAASIRYSTMDTMTLLGEAGR